MKDYVSQRLRYFNGQFLEEDDFADEQAYHLNRRRLHNQHLHTSGIIKGLEVHREDSKRIRVKAGMALDSWGREIILNDDIIKDIKDITPSDGLICVWIEYCEVKIENQDDADANTATRVEEKPIVNVGSSFPDKSGNSYVMLSRFRLNDNGNIPNKNGDLDGVPGNEISKVEPVRAFSGDRSVSVRKLKTELLKKGTIEFNGEINPIFEKSIEVQRSSLSEKIESGHLLVFADVIDFGKVDCAYQWRIQCGAVEDKDTNARFRTQTVIFTAGSRSKFTISYSVYTLLR